MDTMPKLPNIAGVDSIVECILLKITFSEKRIQNFKFSLCILWVEIIACIPCFFHR